MSETTKNVNLQRLNEISSIVSKRDMKIWENVAYSTCLQKQIENLNNKISQMKTIIVEKQKEEKMLIDYIAKLRNTNSIQQETLKITEQSVIMQETLKENIFEEANNFKKQYAETLKMYDFELQEYRSIYENASQSYKDLQFEQLKMHKLEVEKLILDSKITALKRNLHQFNEIQEQIFYKTILHFARFYIIYHKKENLKLQIQLTKKTEQELLKEHLQLAESVKNKRKLRMQDAFIPKDSKGTIIIQTTNKNSMETDKLQKFLNEEILPCSLTSIVQTVPSFNEDNSKVKILNVKMLKPPIRPKATLKSNSELRQRMENIVSTVKEGIKKSNSMQMGAVNLKRSQNTQQIERTGGISPHLSQSKRLSQSGHASSQMSQNRLQPLSTSQRSQGNSHNKLETQISQSTGSLVKRSSQTNLGSQKSQVKSTVKMDSQTVCVDVEGKHEPLLVRTQAGLKTQMSQESRPSSQGETHYSRQCPKYSSQSFDNQSKSDEEHQKRTLENIKSHKSKPTSSSIFKVPSDVNLENTEDVKQENTSKFFNTKKKVVTFQTDVAKPLPEPEMKFSLFPVKDPTEIDIENYKSPFEILQNQNKTIDSNMSMINEVPGDVMTFGTCTTEPTDGTRYDEFTSSMNHGFGEPSFNSPDHFITPPGGTAFNLFGVPDQTTYPFSFK